MIKLREEEQFAGPFASSGCKCTTSIIIIIIIIITVLSIGNKLPQLVVLTTLNRRPTSFRRSAQTGLQRGA
jgi:hypothetical protein